MIKNKGLPGSMVGTDCSHKSPAVSIPFLITKDKSVLKSKLKEKKNQKTEKQTAE